MKCIRMLTFIPLDEIDAMEHWDDSRINEKKKILAFELTKLVHGEEEAKKAEETAASLFSGMGNDANMPKTVLTADEVPEAGYNLVDLMTRCKLCASKSDARRLVQQGGVMVNGVKADDVNTTVSAEDLKAGVVIRKGKKVYHRAVIE